MEYCLELLCGIDEKNGLVDTIFLAEFSQKRR